MCLKEPDVFGHTQRQTCRMTLTSQSLFVVPATALHKETLGIQVCHEYLLWGLKFSNITHFGLFGSLRKPHSAHKELKHEPPMDGIRMTGSSMRLAGRPIFIKLPYLRRKTEGPKRPRKDKDPTKHGFSSVWGPGTRTKDPICMVLWAPRSRSSAVRLAVLVDQGLLLGVSSHERGRAHQDIHLNCNQEFLTDQNRPLHSSLL